MSSSDDARVSRVQRRRAGFRRFTAVLAMVTVVVYVLIAAGVLQPVDTDLHPRVQQVSLAVPAAVAHLVLVLALLQVDWRSVWALASVTHLAAVGLYVQFASVRVPPFERSGLTLAALQVAQALLLAGLAVHRPPVATPDPTPPRRDGPPRVLVATGSTYGSTEEIGEWIAGALREAGLEAEASTAPAVRDVSGYDAVIVGASLSIGRWHPTARHLVRRHRRALAARPVWMFSSGPLDDSASHQDLPPVPTARRLVQLVGARGHVTFGGRLETGRGGPLTRAIASDHAGDWRDPDRVRAWAFGVAAELTGAGRPSDPASPGPAE